MKRVRGRHERPASAAAAETHGKHPRRTTIGRALARTAFGLTLVGAPIIGGALGASVAAVTPSRVEIVDGIHANVTLDTQSYSDIILGASGGVRLHSAHTQVPIVGDVGINASLYPIDATDYHTLVPEISSLISDEGTGVKKLIASTLEHRISRYGGIGIGAGLAVDGALVAGALAARRREDYHKSPNKYYRRTAIAAAAATAVALSFGAGARVSSTPPQPSVMTPIDTSLTSQIDILHGAQFIGTGGEQINALLHAGIDYMNDVQEYWNTNAHITNKKLEHMRRAGKLDWLSDPNVATFVHVSDIHGNIPYIENYLGPVVRKSGVTNVINTGDTYSTSNATNIDRITKPMHYLLDALSPENQDGRMVKIVNIAGNHDPLKLPSDIANTTYTDAEGNSFKPLISTSGTGVTTATIDDITLVIAGDPNRTIHDTTPELLSDQISNDYKQGEKLADTACEITDQTNREPVVAYHEPEGTYETIARGCGRAALSGHIHVMSPIKRMSSVNEPLTSGYLINTGSASGDGPGNFAAVYSKATTTGGLRILGFNKSTGELEHALTVTVTPHGEPKLSQRDLTAMTPRPITHDKAIDASLSIYAPNVLVPDPSVDSALDPPENPTPSQSVDPYPTRVSPPATP